MTPSYAPPLDDRSDRQHWGAVGSGTVISLAAMITALLGGPASAVVTAVLVSCILSILVLTKSATKRAEREARQLTDYRVELGKWQHRLQALEQEAHQATSALAKMRDGVILLAESDEVLLFNPAACGLLNVTIQAGPVGRRFGEVVRIPELTRAIAAARAGDGTQKVSLEITSAEVVRPVKARVDRFTAGIENKILVTLRDETEAHRVDEMRREFIANISHELKTPLAAIKGYAETVELAINDDPEAAAHFMSQINAQCLRLERLISDMMQLARAQAGRSYLKLTTVSLGNVIAESLKSYRPVAEAKQIELIVDPINPTLVHSDREATLTITNNLIGNAIRYTPEGGRVQVGCREAGRFWVLFVQDNGVGIPASEHKRVFERFYRVERTRRAGDEGTGIGLSIVKNLTIALGGEVHVQSAPGQGARFEVFLPQAKTETGAV